MVTNTTVPAPRGPRQPLRVLLYALLGIIALVVLLILGLATPPGRAALVGIIERAASVNGLTLSIVNPTGWPPFAFGAGKITLADRDGPFAEIENARGALRPAALLHGGIVFESLTADRVSMLRLPRLPATPPSESTLPLAIDRFEVTRVELGSALAGRPAVLTASGSFSNGRDDSIALTAKAERTDGIAGKLDATLKRSHRAAPLAIDMRIEEAADGILVGLLGRPGGPGYRLSAKSEVNGEALTGTLSLASTGSARFDGRFASAPVAGARRIQLSGTGELAELAPADYVDLLSGAIAIDLDADWTAAAAGQALPRVAIRKGTVHTASV
ncbi:MAG: hypothetical protein ABI854_02390, partial [Betaproteobacteria bacterium]